VKATAAPRPTRILFVDDEPAVLQGLARLIRSLHTDWELAFATSGRQALDILAAATYDVIVTDMRMPGMDGGSLLREVMHRHPHMVRIVLSGQAEQATILASIGSTHQYLWKPCDPETLQQTLRRACALRTSLADEALKRLVSRLDGLPSPPALYFAVLDECRSPRTSVVRIADIVAQDVAMSAKILQLVNSAFFGRRRRVTSPLQAVQLLGLNTVTALMLSAHVFSEFRGSAKATRFVDRLHAHSLAASAAARLIAASEDCSHEIVDDASVAALLHDIGELILITNLADQYDRAVALHEDGLPLSEAETEIFGATHAAVGAYLLGLWGLPDAVVEAVACHDTPGSCPSRQFGPVTVVHAADVLVGDLGQGDASGAAGRLDRDHLERLGLGDRLPVWREALREASVGSVATGSVHD
jgi:HD-like signal output (HDOD) protein